MNSIVSLSPCLLKKVTPQKCVIMKNFQTLFLKQFKTFTVTFLWAHFLNKGAIYRQPIPNDSLLKLDDRSTLIGPHFGDLYYTPFFIISSIP